MFRAQTLLISLLTAGAMLAGIAQAPIDVEQPPAGRGAAAAAVPAVYANLEATPDGQLVYRPDGAQPLPRVVRPQGWTIEEARGNPRGTASGIAFDFQRRGFDGTLVFGLVPYHDTRYPQPVFRTSTPIVDGRAEVNILRTLSGVYDMVRWREAGGAVLGYRVVTATGGIVHDGRVRFAGTGPFEAEVTLVEGPFVANVSHESAVIWFELDRPAPCEVVVGRRVVPCRAGTLRQEIAVKGLSPATAYRYRVRYGGHEERYGFRTAPAPGARQPFVFAYASDSRGGQGGGERNVSGPNGHILRRLMALARQRQSAFVQFTGDLVSGYTATPDALAFELANWKRAVEPQAHWLPVYTGMGNHDSVVIEFSEAGRGSVRLARFPFDTESAEAVFANALVNPENGPAGEDGAPYDPDPSRTDFPSYRRNVYWYRYDNAAMVVLNSDYWLAPSLPQAPGSGGNLHGYLMDNQVAWLARRLAALERDATIDHVFLTTHTPMFPNGGHVGDAMWYGGNNAPRPTIAGRPLAKGIIERRDDLLALIQRHPKVLAVLTGDEHNYNRMRLTASVPIYPDGWDKPRVRLRRPFFQVNNGAAGAPYYAQEPAPWSAAVRSFSTQHALCFFQVDGARVTLETVNPETLEVLDRVVMR